VLTNEPEDLEALGEALEKLTVTMFVKVMLFLAENFRRCILN